MEFTQLSTIYACFYSKITADMYLELSKTETEQLTFELFENALHHFEFPRVNIYDYDKEIEEYNIALSKEEINIIATYMVVEWLGQQLANIDITRMIYTGADFKTTSQANHMAKLSNLKDKFTQQGFHLQRLYKRRVPDENGIMKSTFGTIMQTSPRERR